MKIYKFDGTTVRSSNNLLFKEGNKIISFKDHIKMYRDYLYERNLSEGTIDVYIRNMEEYYKIFDDVTKQNLILYKDMLINKRKLKSSTINQKIISLNQYLKYINLFNLQLKTVKCLKTSFIDNAITLRDYHRLQKILMDNNQLKLYHIVTILGTTGIRISELTKLNIFDVKQDGIRIYSKGDRLRLVYLPPKVQEDLINWLKEEGRYANDNQALFINRSGVRISDKTIQNQFRNLSKKYKIHGLHPHALRHMFAFAWLDKMSRIKNKSKIEYGVLPMLAQILGHASLETTMIYLKPGAEQIKWYSKQIDW